MPANHLLTESDREKLSALAVLLDARAAELRDNFAVKQESGALTWPTSAINVESLVAEMTTGSAFLRELASP